tara:strand:+ start:21843 stop:22577 length:735 start_codon:yes stop_codon:yes gene_type:complete
MRNLESLTCTSVETLKTPIQISYRSAFWVMMKKEFRLTLQKPMDTLEPICFFMLVVLLFPLALGTEVALLARIAPSAMWIAALLASLLSLEKLFKQDYQDGSLEQLLLTPYPLAWLLFAKVLTHWMVTTLPLIVISPMLAYLLHLPAQAYPNLCITLLLGTPVLNFIGAIGAALTVSVRKGGVLLGLLVMPLYIPVLIFSISAIESVGLGLNDTGHIAILGAMLIACLTFAPLLISASLKVSLN